MSIYGLWEYMAMGTYSFQIEILIDIFVKSSGERPCRIQIRIINYTVSHTETTVQG